MAVLALGKIGDKRAVEALIQATEDKRWFVRSAAKGALKKMKANKSENDQRPTAYNSVYLVQAHALTQIAFGAFRYTQSVICNCSLR